MNRNLILALLAIVTLAAGLGSGGRRGRRRPGKAPPASAGVRGAW
jgi:hypothetical protein